MSKMPIFGNDMTTITKVVRAFSFTEITEVNIAIRQVFLAQASYALTVETITRQAIHLAGSQVDTDEIKAGLTLLVRQGVLRSRMSEGKRLYEVNY